MGHIHNILRKTSYGPHTIFFSQIDIGPENHDAGQE
jgi:hypothetical protein